MDESGRSKECRHRGKADPKHKECKGGACTCWCHVPRPKIKKKVAT